MNERIRELAEQARKRPMGNSWCYTNPAEFEQKFAELIVQECVGIADEYDGVGSTIVSRIKQHFGVEESKGWVCNKCGTDRTKSVCPYGHTAALTGECPMVGVAQ